MTQKVTRAPAAELGEGTGPAAVVAPFAGESIDYAGFRATMSRDEAGNYRMKIVRLVPGGASQPPGAPPLAEFVVDMSVGSHRYQQYLTRIDTGADTSEHRRLPFVWHIGQNRWLPTNAVFVAPDPPEGDDEALLRHFSRWNDNCIFCHNTGPEPRAEGTKFRSQVAELGIACEACHGPAGDHLNHYRDLARRLLADGRGDPRVANPRRLDAGLSSDICGRCHGQRIGYDIAEIMVRGDGFVPGEPLAAVSRPIFRDAEVEGVPAQAFASKFWPDQTPRLSAYEYQGLLLSACHRGEGAKGLGCNECHDMHGDDPKGQIRRGREGALACIGCHANESLSQPRTGGVHGGHGDVAAAIDCLDCHMPKITYGLLEGMISHRITKPDPASWIGRHDQPDACTQCHVDRSRTWAADAIDTWGSPRGPRPPADVREAWASRVVLDLYGGDPLQRMLAAHALSQPKATGALPWRMAALVDALLDDYASVRWFAQRGLEALDERDGSVELRGILGEYDYVGPQEARARIAAQLRARLGPGPFASSPAEREVLESSRAVAELWIGE